MFVCSVWDGIEFVTTGFQNSNSSRLVGLKQHDDTNVCDVPCETPTTYSTL